MYCILKIQVYFLFYWTNQIYFDIQRMTEVVNYPWSSVMVHKNHFASSKSNNEWNAVMVHANRDNITIMTIITIEMIRVLVCIHFLALDNKKISEIHSTNSANL